MSGQTPNPLVTQLVRSLVWRWTILGATIVCITVCGVWLNQRTLTIWIGFSMFGLGLWDLRRTDERIRQVRNATGSKTDDGIARAYSEGKANLMLQLLSQRFGPLPLEAQSRVLSASEQELNDMARRFLDAKSLDDAVTKPANRS